MRCSSLSSRLIIKRTLASVRVAANLDKLSLDGLQLVFHDLEGLVLLEFGEEQYIRKLVGRI